MALSITKSLTPSSIRLWRHLCTTPYLSPGWQIWQVRSRRFLSVRSWWPLVLNGWCSDAKKIQNEEQLYAFHFHSFPCISMHFHSFPFISTFIFIYFHSFPQSFSFISIHFHSYSKNGFWEYEISKQKNYSINPKSIRLEDHSHESPKINTGSNY